MTDFSITPYLHVVVILVTWGKNTIYKQYIYMLSKIFFLVSVVSLPITLLFPQTWISK